MDDTQEIESNSDAFQLTNSFGVYVHIPFCVHRCSYCEFYTSVKYQGEDFELLSLAIIRELKQVAKSVEKHFGRPRPVKSIFFGGGTPSLSPPKYIQGIINAIRETFDIVPNPEISLEANPETVTTSYAKALAGSTEINRVSLGAQSFDPRHLKSLERLASAEDIERAVGNFQKAGFENLNLDLIFAIPGQTLEGMLSDISKAASLSPAHLSFYQLTLSPGHSLYAKLPSQEIAADMYEEGIRALEAEGFYLYEISNFSKPGKKCEHNLLYWSGGDFLGLGPSAASRFFHGNRFFHRKEVSSFENYRGQGGKLNYDFEKNSYDQTILEAVFLEMRTKPGIDLAAFSRKYQYDIAQAPKYESLRGEGLIKVSDGLLELSSRGRLLADSIAQELTP